MIRRTRYNYWSCSKFAYWLREKAGLENPVALTAEGWAEHKKQSKAKAPFVHWFTGKFLNKLQNVVFFIPDLMWSIRTATIWTFFRNVWLFRKALWNYYGWDYSGLLRFMETAAEDMSEHHKKHSYLMRGDETAKELHVWAELLKRVREHDYHEDKEGFVYSDNEEDIFGGKFVQRPNALPSNKSKSFYKMINQQRRDDLKLIAKMFERKVQSWWS